MRIAESTTNQACGLWITRYSYTSDELEMAGSPNRQEESKPFTY
jgi:hypothetical protein